MRKQILALFALCLVLLPACGSADGEKPQPAENVLTYASLNPMTDELEKMINNFNKAHEDIQIEVLDYSDEGGIQRLFTELALGWVPDVMELHREGEPNPPGDTGFRSRYNEDRREGEYWLPYRQMVQKGYLEDLWPYIENDPELGREGVLEAPLKAAEVDGGLYMLFMHATIVTAMSAESVVGDRCGWTLEELMETFAAMPEDSTIMRYDATRWDIYSRVLCMALDRYIDWETGECSFDCKDFRDVMEFLRSLPDEVETANTAAERNEELFHRAFGGQQLLEAVEIDDLHSMIYNDVYFGADERSVYVGFPTADGSSGSFFRPEGYQLAMSAICRNKEAAWDFMRQLIVQHHFTLGSMKKVRWAEELYFPINREDYELGNRFDMSEPPSNIPPYWPFYGGPAFKVFAPTEEHLQRLEALMDRITQLYWPDDALSDIVWDTAGAYFAGDRTLDDTIRLIDNRVGLYISENQ